MKVAEQQGSLKENKRGKKRREETEKEKKRKTNFFSLIEKIIKIYENES